MMQAHKIVSAIRIGANPLRAMGCWKPSGRTEVKNVVDKIGASGCEPDTSLAG